MPDPATPAAPVTDTPTGDSSTPPVSDPPPAASPSADPPPAPAASTPPPAGPDDGWRQRWAGDDEKALKRLERYASPKDAVKALVEAQAKLSAGDFARPLPADATPEQTAAWREANGIPKEAKGYFEKLPDGLVIGEQDLPYFESLAAELHTANVPPAAVHKIVGWYNKFVDEQTSSRAEAQRAGALETEETLRGEWGADYRANRNHIAAFLDKAPGGVKERVLAARMDDGRFMIEDPAVMRWLANTARELDPIGSVLPAGGSSQQGLNDEIAGIEKLMRENRPAYIRDNAVQERYRQLLDARDKLAKAS